MKTRTDIIGETNWYEVAKQCYYGYVNGDIDALTILEYYGEVLAEYECCCCGESPDDLRWIFDEGEIVFGTGEIGRFFCRECADAEGVIDYA